MMCLLVADQSHANGAPVVEYDYMNSGYDQWVLEKAETKNWNFINEKALSYLIPIGDETMGGVVPYATHVEQNVTITEYRSQNKKRFDYISIVSNHSHEENPELVGDLQFKNVQLTIDNQNYTNLLEEDTNYIIPDDWTFKKGIVWDGDHADIGFIYNINQSYNISVLTTLIVPTAFYSYGEAKFDFIVN